MRPAERRSLLGRIQRAVARMETAPPPAPKPELIEHNPVLAAEWLRKQGFRVD